jgi:hypothetical protein
MRSPNVVTQGCLFSKSENVLRVKDSVRQRDTSKNGTNLGYGNRNEQNRGLEIPEKLQKMS